MYNTRTPNRKVNLLACPFFRDPLCLRTQGVTNYFYLKLSNLLPYLAITCVQCSLVESLAEVIFKSCDLVVMIVFSVVADTFTVQELFYKHCYRSFNLFLFVCLFVSEQTWKYPKLFFFFLNSTVLIYAGNTIQFRTLQTFYKGNQVDVNFWAG